MKKSPPPASAALRVFLFRLPVALALAMTIWFVIRPVLDTTVCAGAEMLMRGYEHPRVTRLQAADHHARVHRADLRHGSTMPTVPLTSIHFNTIVLLALFLALPAPRKRTQLERLIMGWTVLLVTQIVSLFVHVKFIYATMLGDWSVENYSETARNIYGFLQYFTDLPGRFAFPFLIWIAFNWDLVMGMITERDEV